MNSGEDANKLEVVLTKIPVAASHAAVLLEEFGSLSGNLRDLLEVERDR